MKTKTARVLRHGGAKTSKKQPQMPVALPGMGSLAQKLDAAFREIAEGQITVRDAAVTAPRDYSANDVRKLRESMRVSQGVFALLFGVSPETVENWEQGIISPRPIARRLLDLAAANPVAYRSMFLQERSIRANAG